MGVALTNSTELAVEINENEGKIFLHFALGKAYEDINDYKNSSKHIQKANNLKNMSINYNINNEIQLFKNIKKFFNNPKINQIKNSIRVKHFDD